MGSKVNGIVYNDTPFDIFYSLTTQKLNVENMEKEKQTIGEVSLCTNPQKMIEIDLNGHHKNLTKKFIKSSENKSFVRVPSKCALNVGLTKIEKGECFFSLWYGYQNGEPLILDELVKENSDVCIKVEGFDGNVTQRQMEEKEALQIQYQFRNSTKKPVIE